MVLARRTRINYFLQISREIGARDIAAHGTRAQGTSPTPPTLMQNQQLVT